MVSCVSVSDVVPAVVKRLLRAVSKALFFTAAALTGVGGDGGVAPRSDGRRRCAAPHDARFRLGLCAGDLKLGKRHLRPHRLRHNLSPPIARNRASSIARDTRLERQTRLDMVPTPRS